MKKYILLVAFLLGTVYYGNAQCRAFAKTTGVVKLDTINYEHDGRYNALKLSEGDEIEIFKTIIANKDYKLLVCASDELPQNLEFTVMDFDRNILFDNSENGQQFWEFSMDTNKRIIISIRIPRKTASNQERARGCIAVMLGTRIGG